MGKSSAQGEKKRWGKEKQVDCSAAVGFGDRCTDNRAESESQDVDSQGKDGCGDADTKMAGDFRDALEGG